MLDLDDPAADVDGVEGPASFRGADADVEVDGVFFICGDSISSETVAALLSIFFRGGMRTPSNRTCFPLSFDALSAWNVAQACAIYGWNAGLVATGSSSLSDSSVMNAKADGSISSTTGVSGYDAARMPAVT